MALTKQQLAARQTRIGGSDAGAICGKDQYRDAFQVAMRITGQLPPDAALEENDTIMIGNEMEVVLANIYEKKNKLELYTPDTIVHPKHEFLAVNIDRRIKGNPRIGIECKNNGLYVTEGWGKPGTDQVPERVLLQVAHAMMLVPEIELFYVLRCYAGNQYQQFIVPRNDDLNAALLGIELEFYANVKAGRIPEPDWHLRTTAPAMKRMFAKIEGVIEARPDLEHWTKVWEETERARAEADALSKALKNRIVHMMGNTEIATLADGRKWRRKLVKKGAYSVEPAEYIECRLVKPRAKKTAEPNEEE